MKLIICNGSPRGRKANTAILAGAFSDGFVSVAGNEIEELLLANVSMHDRYVKQFEQADAVLFAFPLYFNSMPGTVKAFIEKLTPIQGRRASSISMAGFVHNGYPNSESCRFVQRYIEKLGKRLNVDYRGTIVIPGTEGVRIMPRWMTRSVRRSMFSLGEGFAHNRNLNSMLLKHLAQPEYIGPVSRFFYRYMPSSLVNFYWIRQLKANGVYEKHADRPFDPGR